MTESKKPAWKWGRRLRLIFGGILVGLLIAEVVLRISGFTYFNPYIPDEDVGYSLRPGAEGWWKREALTYVKINSHGFRDREHTLEKPAGTLRIAVLGDSYAEAFQVPPEKAFWSVMERKLQDCAPTATRNVEVLNFGVSGFSTARELILLRKRVWQYSPDVIVLLVTTGNDIRDNSRRLNDAGASDLPYFVVQGDKLVLDDSLLVARNRTFVFRLRQTFIGKSFSWVQSNLRLLGLFYAVREAWSADSDREKKHVESAGHGGERGLDDAIYLDPVTPEWNDAWLVTERLIVKMRDEVKEKGARFLVVTGSNGIQVNPDLATRQAFMERIGILNLFYPDQRIKALGEREGVDVLNLAPAIAEYASQHNQFLHGADDAKGKGHWNETGHRLAGELIAEQLCKATTEEK